MRPLFHTSVVLLLGVVLSGCAVHKATVQGHDLMLAGLDEIQTGIDEYREDDLAMNQKIRDRLAAALVTEVVKNAKDERAVKEKLTKFLTLMDQNDLDRTRGEQRYQAMKGTIRAIRDTTHKLRDLEELKLGWRDDVMGYVRALRAAKETK